MRLSGRGVHSRIPSGRFRALVVRALVPFASCLLLASVSPAPAGAAEATSVPATMTAITTVTVDGYDVDFTLPTNAKAGCMVCHSDPDLIRLKEGALVSYWVDAELVEASAHATVQCTGCHLDFAFKTPHTDGGTDWDVRAKSACSNCHLDQSALVAKGAHRPGTVGGAAPDPAADEKPLCGDCHGSHGIEPLTDSPEGRASLSRRGRQVCGQEGCHADYWDTYDDYYHGAAYKRGAIDAPACWDCHRGHDVLPVDDKDSSVNERHIVETCAQCHPDANESYAEYAKLVHGRQDIADGIFLYGWVTTLRNAVMSLFGG